MADYDDMVGGKVGSDAEGFAALLANAIQQAVAVGVSNNGKAPVPPALLKKRHDAHNRMHELLVQFEESDTPPRYEVIVPHPGGFFIDDVLLPNGEIIDYCGVPNEGLAPLNDAGRQVMEQFLISIGGGTPDLADQSYEAYVNRPRQAALVSARPEAPALGTPRTLQAAKVAVVEQQPRRYVGPRRAMGTAPVESPGQF